MKLIDKLTKNYEDREKKFKQEELAKEQEQAKKEHPDNQVWQGEGYLLKTNKGYRINKTLLNDLFQLYSGQRVKILIMDAEADVEYE